MPDALDLLNTRRSVKPVELKGPAPSAAEIDTILTVAARVPDHGKLVPWRFIVFVGDGRLKAGDAIAAVFRADHPEAKPEHVEMERTRLARAPLVIAVVIRPPRARCAGACPQRAHRRVRPYRPPGAAAHRPAAPAARRDRHPLRQLSEPLGTIGRADGYVAVRPTWVANGVLHHMSVTALLHRPIGPIIGR